MGLFTDSLIAPAKMALGLSELMLKDVTPQIFARKPTINGTLIQANHAAFNYGHLAIYPGRWLAMLGFDGSKLAPPVGFDDLFAAGKECKDDPEGTIYPSMEVITSTFRTGHREALEALKNVDDAIFAKPNPREAGRDRLPTIGAAMIFYTNSHMMMHLGQVSTWRRCFGLGSVM